MIYFVSGHRDLSYEDFQKYYVPVLVNVLVDDGYPMFLIGDCNGVDKFAMDYIYKHMRCGELIIYHMFDSPRNTPEGYIKRESTSDEWLEEDLVDVHFMGGFQSDEERDSAMTENSDCDIAFIKDNRWNSGTAQNIKRRHNIV